ncbi:MAG: hypothetical protein COB22_05940 [Cycloclasticus sp.]|nr:MAG: hypothetical protein COB22_05940 [Cycloclasticus sp.]
MIKVGVGGRHKETKTPVGVAGYLDNCTNSGYLKKSFFDDPRISELREMGLSRHWVDIAESIGFDSFIVVWQKLSDHDDTRSSKCSIYVPRFAGWIKYQRNRVIISLRSSGFSYSDIQDQIKVDLGERVSVSHIKRIVALKK